MSSHIKSAWHSSWNIGRVLAIVGTSMWFFSFVSTWSLFTSIFSSWPLFSKFYPLFFIVLFLDVVSLLALHGPPLCRQILTRWPLDILGGLTPLFAHNCVARTYFLESILTLVSHSMSACFLTRFCHVSSILSLEEFDLSAISKNCITLKMKSQVSPSLSKRLPFAVFWKIVFAHLHTCEWTSWGHVKWLYPEHMSEGTTGPYKSSKLTSQKS